MSRPFEIGKSITESIAFVSAIAAECEHLAKLMKEEISTLLLSPEIAVRYRAYGDWQDVYDSDESGWLYTDLGISLPITIKPKRSVCGYLILQISLTGSGMGASENQEPLLHLGWWTSALDFGDFKMVFPQHLDPEYPHTLEAERLFRWSGLASPSSSEWCYSVRLTDINRPNDVKRNLINPLRALLLGQRADLALSGTSVVKYAPVEEVPGQYRVLSRLDVFG